MGGDAVLDRFHAAAFAAALVVIGAGATPVSAQDYPTRPVTIIVASTAGGGTDIVARIIGEQLSKELGQPFVVDNRPGAGSVIGTVAAANATPDGYTLLAGLNRQYGGQSEPVRESALRSGQGFRAGGMLAKFPFVVVVSKNFPAQSIKELIALAKAKPGRDQLCLGGNGTGQQLSMELFKLETGINLTHVPYRGAAPAYADVISGQVPVFFDNLASALGQIKAGNGARARGHRHGTLAAVAGRADRRRSRRARLPILCVVRAMGAERNAAADHRKLHAAVKKALPTRR